MFNKFALSAAIILSTAITATAATKPHVTSVDESAAYNAIDGYDKDGGVVAIPNPDQSGMQSKRQ